MDDNPAKALATLGLAIACLAGASYVVVTRGPRAALCFAAGLPAAGAFVDLVISTGWDT